MLEPSRIFIASVLFAIVVNCRSEPLAGDEPEPNGTAGASAQQGQGGSGAGIGGSPGGGDAPGTAGEAGSDTAGGDGCLGAAGSPTAGKACGCNRDCDAEEICAAEGLEGVGPPGGLCLRICATDEHCPEGLACVAPNPGGTERMCMQSCTETSACRDGYLCGALGVFLGQPPEDPPEPFVCLPWCQSDSDCPKTGACNPFTGICGSHGSATSDVADPCARLEDCESSTFCFVDASYCSTWCSLSRQGCPEGSTCENPFFDDRGDLGACMKSCDSSNDCREDQDCVRVESGRPPVCGPSE